MLFPCFFTVGLRIGRLVPIRKSRHHSPAVLLFGSRLCANIKYPGTSQRNLALPFIIKTNKPTRLDRDSASGMRCGAQPHQINHLREIILRILAIRTYRALHLEMRARNASKRKGSTNRSPSTQQLEIIVAELPDGANILMRFYLFQMKGHLSFSQIL